MASCSFIVCFLFTAPKHRRCEGGSLFSQVINSDGWQNGLRYHSGSLRPLQPSTIALSVLELGLRPRPLLPKAAINHSVPLCLRASVLKQSAPLFRSCSGCRARSLSRSRNAPAPKASGWPRAKPEPRSGRKSPRVGPFPTLGVAFLFVELRGVVAAEPFRNRTPQSRCRLSTRLRAAALPQTASFTPVVKDQNPEGFGTCSGLGYPLAPGATCPLMS